MWRTARRFAALAGLDAGLEAQLADAESSDAERTVEIVLQGQRRRTPAG
jgi:hypothetical protein